MMKYHRPGDLNNRNLFLTVLEAVKSKIKELADLMSDKNLLPGLQMAAFSLHAHMASPWCVCEVMSLPLLIRLLIPS